MDTMSSWYSTDNGEVRKAWEVERLWVCFETTAPVDWIIPDSFKESWNWGQEHPADHIDRCLQADLSYPILVWEGIIVDGTHRAIKALALGRKSIPARVISIMPEPDEITTPEPHESNDGIHWTHGDMIKLTKAFLTITKKD